MKIVKKDKKMLFQTQRTSKYFLKKDKKTEYRTQKTVLGTPP